MRTSITAVEVLVVAEQGRRGAELQRPWTYCLGATQLGLQGPAVSADFADSAVSVLPGGHRDLQARANDQVLLVVLELLQRQGGRPVKVDREPDPGIREPVDDPLQALASLVRRSR